MSIAHVATMFKRRLDKPFDELVFKFIHECLGTLNAEPLDVVDKDGNELTLSPTTAFLAEAIGNEPSDMESFLRICHAPDGWRGTLMLGEKHVDVERYRTTSWAGFTDGWVEDSE